MQIWEILPGKLWQASFVGAVESILRFDCVISCTYLSDLIPSVWPLHICFPFEDENKLPNMDRLHSVVQFAVERINCGETVLVNCNAGRNRSGLVCGLILSELGFKNVAQIIKAAHPEALDNQTFVNYLNSL